jgi:ATPase subunit of ABC transporter with duplicated ATPase domains
VLLKDPNVLLLDEPTNHLDLESVEWLEDFLRNQKIPMVIVSHDREFLDQVCTKIVDTEAGVATTYDGNYSNFLKLKRERMKAWQSKWDAQEKKINEERAWIQKFKTKQPDAVRQRQAKLDKLLKSEVRGGGRRSTGRARDESRHLTPPSTRTQDAVKRPPFSKPFRFRFPPAPRLSDEIAIVQDITHGYVRARSGRKSGEARAKHARAS